MRAAILGSAAAVAAALSDPVGPYLPWGIHLAYGNDPQTSMQVMWSTRQPVAGSQARYGLTPSALTLIANGTVAEFTDVNNTQYIHHVALTDLLPGTQYYYLVSDGAGNDSAVFHFSTYTDDPDYAPTFTIFGDFGVDINAHRSLPLLIEDAASGAMDVVLHIGDIAYDLDSNNGANGDQFVAMTQNYSAYIPTHFCPGNHENANDFRQYIGRFNDMPLAPQAPSAAAAPAAAVLQAAQQAAASAVPVDSMYHSLNVGPVHVVMFSSEAYFYLSPHGLPLVAQQYAWLEADLAAVDRSVTPWVITMAHRPLYCSPNDDQDDCHSVSSIVRDGILGQYGIETLLYKYGVDMHFGAHEHSYERNYPVYQFQWNPNVTGAAAYVNPDRPIHILTGAAGCPENQDPWQSTGNPFSSLRLNIYGYGRITFHNASHATWVMIDDSTGAVADSIDIVQESHGPFTSGLDAADGPALQAAWDAAIAGNKRIGGAGEAAEGAKGHGHRHHGLRAGARAQRMARRNEHPAGPGFNAAGQTPQLSHEQILALAEAGRRQAFGL